MCAFQDFPQVFLCNLAKVIFMEYLYCKKISYILCAGNIFATYLSSNVSQFSQKIDMGIHQFCYSFFFPFAYYISNTVLTFGQPPHACTLSKILLKHFSTLVFFILYMHVLFSQLPCKLIEPTDYLLYILSLQIFLPSQ